MHYFIKVLALFCCLCLCACAPNCRLEYLDCSYDTDSQSVSLKIPQIKGLSDSEFQSGLNGEIEEACNEFLDKFKASAKGLIYKSVFTAESKSYAHDGLFSLVTQIDYYTKKPHNNSFRITKNINTKTSRCLQLGDLFENDGYIDFLNNTLSEIAAENPDDYSILWVKPQLSSNQGFYVTDEELILYYPPYELSYYSRGFIEFSIPLKSLGGYLTDEYREILLEKS